MIVFHIPYTTMQDRSTRRIFDVSCAFEYTLIINFDALQLKAQFSNLFSDNKGGKTFLLIRFTLPSLERSFSVVLGMFDDQLMSLMKTRHFLQESLTHVFFYLIHSVKLAAIHRLNSKSVKRWTETSSKMLENLGIVKVKSLELHIEKQSLVFDVFLLLRQNVVIWQVIIFKLNALFKGLINLKLVCQRSVTTMLDSMELDFVKHVRLTFNEHSYTRIILITFVRHQNKLRLLCPTLFHSV